MKKLYLSILLVFSVLMFKCIVSYAGLADLEKGATSLRLGYMMPKGALDSSFSIGVKYELPFVEALAGKKIAAAIDYAPNLGISNSSNDAKAIIFSVSYQSPLTALKTSAPLINTPYYGIGLNYNKRSKFGAGDDSDAVGFQGYVGYDFPSGLSAEVMYFDSFKRKALDGVSLIVGYKIGFN